MFGDYHAHLLESGSATRKGEEADARLIRYNTSYFPENVGIELVVKDLEDLRLDAEMQESRLVYGLQELCINFDCALATKSSENGRRMNEIRHEQNMAKIDARVTREGLDNMDDINYKEKKLADPRKY